MRTVPITAIVTAYQRVQQTTDTLTRIQSCRPVPAEILVHVDAAEYRCKDILQEAFPTLKILLSEENIGPGGGRNRLIQAAQNDIVASFDDDSYPIDSDYFERLFDIFHSFPDASIIGSHIFEQKDRMLDPEELIGLTAHYGGGGVAYRRDDFLNTDGFLPIPVPYGIEEVDLCIRLLNSEKKIYYSPWLRVYHDNSLEHHKSSSITSASIANLVLLTFLRYPVIYWPYGIMQVLNRIFWLIKAKRFNGILRGIINVPTHLLTYRSFRKPVSHKSLREYLILRKQKPVLMPLRLPGKDDHLRNIDA